MNLQEFWRATLKQDAVAMKAFFHPDARIYWHCTNESFTAEAFIQANCTYPGDWSGEILHCFNEAGHTVTITHVYPVDHSADFYVTSLFQIRDDKILRLDEYWADAGPAPQWRQEMHLATPIR